MPKYNVKKIIEEDYSTQHRIGSIGKNNNINQNGTQQINYNLVNNLKVLPKDIDLVATINNRWFPIVYLLVSVPLFGFILHTFFKFFTNTPFFLGFIICGLFMIIWIVVLLDLADKISHKFSIWHVHYKDGSLIIKNNIYRFYDDIWDIEYNPSYFGLSGKLVLYIIHPETKNPFQLVLSFTYKSKAKYLFDSFFNPDRIQKHLKNTH